MEILKHESSIKDFWQGELLGTGSMGIVLE